MLKNNLYNIEVHDGLVPKSAQGAIWDYLSEQQWKVRWNAVPEIPASVISYKPSDGAESWFKMQPIVPRLTSFARCPLASTEENLRERHPIIWGLWKMINNGLNNEYEIAGYPEDIIDEHDIPPSPGMKEGWRVYVNGMFGTIGDGGTWGPHRDTPDLNDETSVTMLYIVNPEWYPRHAGELVYFPEDPEGLSGDHQQFNRSTVDQSEVAPGIRGGQSRGYNIGWPDQGRIVSPVPGRVIIQDGRCLHNSKHPTGSINTALWKIVFRARRKTPWPD